MSWAPEEHTRRAQRQAQDVRRCPKQWVLISVRRDALVRLATIDVRHALVEVLLPGHIVSIMDPIRLMTARFNVLCLEHRVPGSALVAILACTRPTCALDRAVPQTNSLALDTAAPFLHCNVNQGVLQCLMPMVTFIRWQDTTDHIPTKPQLLCMLLHACALEDIHNTAPAIDIHKLRQQAWHRKA